MSFVKRHKINIIVLFVLSLGIDSILFSQFYKDPFFYFAADNSELYFPGWVFLNKALYSGHFPLLNPYWFGGSLPMGGIESTIFYPPTLFSQLLFSPSSSLNTAYLIFFGNEILHYFIGAIGFYLLLKDGLKLNSFSSIFGAIIYIGSGSFIGRFVHFIVIITLAWLPYLYWAHLRFIETKKKKYAVGIILFLIMIITGSHPQFTYYVFIFYGILVLLSTIVVQKKERVFVLIASIILLVLACLLTAPKLLLTYELSQNIVHSTLETSVANLYNSLHPLYFLSLFVPYLFGKHRIGYWGSEYPWGNWDNYIYIGIIPLFFLFFALFWKKRSLLFIFTISLLTSVLFLMGKYNPLSSFINKSLPLAKSLSMVSKMTVQFHFFLCILSSIGINVFIESIRKKKTAVASALLSIVFAGVIYWLGSTYNSLRPFDTASIPSVAALEFVKKNVQLAINIFGFSIAIITCSLIFKQKKILYLLLVVFAVDIFVNGGSFNPIEPALGTPENYFGPRSISSIIKNDSDIFRVNNLWPRNINMVQSIESTGGYHTIETNSFHNVAPYMNSNNFLDLINVKYSISPEQPGQRFVELEPSLWQNTSNMGRLSYIPYYRLVSSDHKAFSQVSSDTYKPNEQVLLTDNNDTRSALKQFKQTLSPNSYQDIPKSKILIKNYLSDKITAQLDIFQNGFILFNQFQYPGWRAKVDDAEVTLLKANGFQYAVPISGGKHHIEFYFQSLPFLIGTAIQITTLIGIGAISLFQRRNKLYLFCVNISNIFVKRIRMLGNRKRCF